MAQSQERRGKMPKISRTCSGRSGLFALFLRFTRFTNRRVTRLGLGVKPFGSPWCFSAQLRWSRWGPQLPQKCGQSTSNLRQSQDRASGFPRAIATDQQGTSQHQLIVGTCHYLRPAFCALGSTQSRHIPEQFLLVETIAMLMRLAPI